MLKNLFETQRKSIVDKLRLILNSDLPQVTPFLNIIGLSSPPSPSHVLSFDEISSIWYWFGVWDPMLQLIEGIAINSWLKQLLFKKIFYKIQFIRSRYQHKYEMIQSFDKTYNIITWFSRHLLIAKFIFKLNITDYENIFNMNFLSTFYYRFLGYFSSAWFQLLFHIDIYAPTLPLFLDNLENDRNTVKIIQKCGNLCNLVYGPQNITMRFIRHLRWILLPETMSNTLKQYSYWRYNKFITKQLKHNGFILKYLAISDSHSQNISDIDMENDDEYKGGHNPLSYMIVLEKSTNHLFVVFRGTELVTDFYHDMFFSDVQSTYSNISVHAGYYAALFGSDSSNILSMEEEINKILMENPTISQIYFTGHSMGAALACLCGIELLARGQLIRTEWYDEKKSIYHHHHNHTQSSSSLSIEENKENKENKENMDIDDGDYKNRKNIQRLFKEYMKLSNNDSSFYDKRELTKIDIQWITFGGPCFISSLTENKKFQRLQPSHPVYSSSYFHDRCIHIVHEYDPIPILSFGTYGVLKRHFLTWFTKGHLNKYFQPLMITLGSVITERSLGLELILSKYMGFNNNTLFGRFLMCIAIHQVIRNKILVRMSKSIYNHINYSSFNELEKIYNRSIYKTMGWKYLHLTINAALYPFIFYLIDHGFLDYGIWRSLSLRVIATRLCISAISSIWNNMTLIIRDLYESATYFPIPNKSGKYLILIPEDDVLYGTYLHKIEKTTGHSYFKTMRKPVQPYTWFAMHTQQNYCKSIERMTSLEDDYSQQQLINNDSTGSSQEKSRRSSIQMQQQIIAEISMFPNSNDVND